MGITRPYPVISADSHIVEPPNCYVDHIEPRYRDIAPRCDVNAKGAAAYTINGLNNPIPVGMLAAAGMTPEQIQDIVLGTLAAAHDAGDLIPPQQMMAPIEESAQHEGMESPALERQEEAQQATPMPNVAPQGGQQ